MIKATDQNFKDILKTNKKIFLDFYADWCGPCQTLLPIVEQLSKEMEDVVFVKANVDECQELSSFFQVRSIPALIIIQNEEVKAARTGAIPKNQLKQWIESN